MNKLLFATFLLVLCTPVTEAQLPRDFKETLGQKSNTLVPQYGPYETLSGTYELEPVTPPGREAARYLHLGSGERLILGYGIQPEEFHLVDRSTKVRGRRYWPPAGTSPLRGTHFQVKQIGLAPGESPNPDANRVFPLPPVAQTGDVLVSRVDRWVRAEGILKSVIADPRTLSHRARLVLGDGTVVSVDYLPKNLATSWRKEMGKSVTIIGRAQMGRPMKLTGPFALCPGSAPICSKL